MAARKPATEEALLEVSGVGQSKLQRYGDAFLGVIADDEEGSRAPDTLV
ncbi:MAG: HRDC domain-containing protein [Actinomycetes bacterium]